MYFFSFYPSVHFELNEFQKFGFCSNISFLGQVDDRAEKFSPASFKIFRPVSLQPALKCKE